MRDKGRFNKDLTVVYQQPLSSTNVVVPVELIARREEPESSMAVLDLSPRENAGPASRARMCIIEA